jgi:hypothetical protein
MPLPRHAHRHQGRAHVVEAKASSLFEAVAQWVKRKDGHIATDGFRPVKVLVYEPKAEYEVKLKAFMAWLDRNSRRRGRRLIA